MMMATHDWAGRGSPTDVLISADRTPESAWADWVAAMLEPNGMAVHRVGSGDDALRVLRSSPVRLAMLDTRLSGVGGLGLLRRIRSIAPKVPCVLVARRVDHGYLRKALALSAYSVLTTPVDRTILRELVAAVFRRFYESELEL